VRTLPPAIAILIEAAGGVPDPYKTDMQWRRFHHRDLLDLHDDELEAERVCVAIARAALLRDRFGGSDRELAWFTQRLASVLGEQERRSRRR
jgi:hypothetical protein